MASKRDFTDRFLKSIKPTAPGKRRIFFDAQIPGFGIRVTERSADECKGSFVLVTRYPGSPNPVAPPHWRLSGHEPRRRREKSRENGGEDIAKGIDPKEKAAEAEPRKAAAQGEHLWSGFRDLR